MAQALARSGRALRYGTAPPERCLPLQRLETRVASSPDEVFENCEVVLLMLSDAGAADEVLGRGTPRFTAVRDHVVVPMGTTAPSYSEGLAAAVNRRRGGTSRRRCRGLACPPSGAELLMMFGGDDDVIDVVEPVLARCIGEPCAAVRRPVHTADEADRERLPHHDHGRAGRGPPLRRRHLSTSRCSTTSSATARWRAISRLKAAKLLAEGRAPQAAAGDVWRNSRLIIEAAVHADGDLSCSTSARRSTPTRWRARARGHDRRDRRDPDACQRR